MSMSKPTPALLAYRNLTLEQFLAEPLDVQAYMMLRPIYQDGMVLSTWAAGEDEPVLFGDEEVIDHVIHSCKEEVDKDPSLKEEGYPTTREEFDALSLYEQHDWQQVYTGGMPHFATMDAENSLVEVCTALTVQGPAETYLQTETQILAACATAGLKAAPARAECGVVVYMTIQKNGVPTSVPYLIVERDGVFTPSYPTGGTLNVFGETPRFPG
jgi:hypothetical protein